MRLPVQSYLRVKNDWGGGGGEGGGRNGEVAQVAGRNGVCTLCHRRWSKLQEHQHELITRAN